MRGVIIGSNIQEGVTIMGNKYANQKIKKLTKWIYLAAIIVALVVLGITVWNAVQPEAPKDKAAQPLTGTYYVEFDVKDYGKMTAAL